MLKDSRYQKSIIREIFKRIPKKNSLSQSQEETQATDVQEEEISMSISLLYVKGASEKMWHIVTSHYKIRFLQRNTLCNLLFKLKG